MILTGKTLKPDKAKKLGLVDLVVDPFSLESVAISQVRKLHCISAIIFLHLYLCLSLYFVIIYSSRLLRPPCFWSCRLRD